MLHWSPHSQQSSSQGGVASGLAPIAELLDELLEEKPELLDELIDELLDDKPELLDELNDELLEDKPELLDELNDELLEDKPELLDELNDELLDDSPEDISKQPLSMRAVRNRSSPPALTTTPWRGYYEAQ